MSSTTVVDDEIEEFLCDTFDRPTTMDDSIHDFSFEGAQMPANPVDGSEPILSPVSNVSSGSRRDLSEVIDSTARGVCGDTGREGDRTVLYRTGYSASNYSFKICKQRSGA